MKRPLSVYILSGFYLLIFFFWLLLVIFGELNFFPLAFYQLIWKGYQTSKLFQLVVWTHLLFSWLCAYGILRGRSYGRNLSLTLSLMLIIRSFLKTLYAFTATKPTMLSPVPRTRVYLNLIFLGIASLILYLSLLPSVGRHCRVYPKKSTAEPDQI